MIKNKRIIKIISLICFIIMFSNYAYPQIFDLKLNSSIDNKLQINNKNNFSLALASNFKLGELYEVFKEINNTIIQLKSNFTSIQIKGDKNIEITYVIKNGKNIIQIFELKNGKYIKTQISQSWFKKMIGALSSMFWTTEQPDNKTNELNILSQSEQTTQQKKQSQNNINTNNKLNTQDPVNTPKITSSKINTPKTKIEKEKKQQSYLSDEEVNMLHNARQFRKQGIYDKALSCLTILLNQAKTRLGENNIELATIYSDIATTYQDKEDYELAISYNMKALNIYEKNLEPDDDAIIIIYNNLGTVYHELGNNDNALIYLEKALQMSIKKYGENSLQIATTLNNIGRIHSDMGNKDKALKYYYNALNIRINNLPAPDLETADIYFNIAQITPNCIYALTNYNNALNIYIKFFGPNHIKIGVIYNFIGSIYNTMNRKKEAFNFYNASIRIKRNHFGVNYENCYETMLTYNNLANLFLDLHDYKQAKYYFDKVLDYINKNHLECDDWFVCTVYNNFATYCLELNKYDTGLDYLLKVVPSIKQHNNYSLLATAYINMGLCYRGIQQYSNAMDSFREAEKILSEKLKLKDNNDDTVQTLQRYIRETQDMQYKQLTNGQYDPITRQVLRETQRNMEYVSKDKKITMSELFQKMGALKNKLIKAKLKTEKSKTIIDDGENKYEVTRHIDGMTVIMKYVEGKNKNPIDMEIIEEPIIDVELIEKILGVTILSKIMKSEKIKLKFRIDYIRQILKPLFDPTIPINSLSIFQNSAQQNLISEDIRKVRLIRTCV
jgi:tetratricopeptide (TPR) repeat protein